MTTAATQQQLKPAAKPTRMKLSGVIKGKIQAPLRILLYGVEGIGKSSFGAGSPKPIFLGAEDGTAQLDVERFPKPETLADVHDAILELGAEAHDYQSLVVDTLDWLEPLIWKFVCAKAGVTSIEDVGGGYGKGYTAAVDEWRRLVAAFERLQTQKRMNVILLAHSWIKPFKNPEGPDFDRYELKLNAKAAGLVKEWSDAVLFAKYETMAVADKAKRVRGVDTGARIIHTEQRAAFDAKNRYSLPETLPLSWSDFSAAVQAGRVAEPATLREEILRKAKELGADVEAAVAGPLQKAGDNAQSLAVINNRLNLRLAEKAAAETAAPAAEKAAN